MSRTMTVVKGYAVLMAVCSLWLLSARATAGEATTEVARPDQAVAVAVERAAAGDQPAAKADTGLVWAEDRMNVVDRAHFAIAHIQFGNKRYKEAAAEMDTVVQQSPDSWAVSAAHLNLGTLYSRFLGDMDRAIEEYTQVAGDLRNRALEQIVALYEQQGQWEKAAAALEEMIVKVGDDRRGQADLLYRIAMLYQRYGQDDRAIEALDRVTKTVTYDEAQQWNRRARRRRRPDGGAAAPSAQAIRDRIARLREQGDNERADRMEQWLQRRQQQDQGNR